MRICFSLCLLCLYFGINAQQYPPEWLKYTSGGYIYDIQSDYNNRDLTETKFKNYLLDIARTNLAKQIQVQVQDVAKLDKLSNNGRTSITYSSNTSFSTDVNLKLVETKTSYDPTTKQGFAIAYLNRDAAQNYYQNELMLVYNKIDNSVVLSNNFIESGFKTKAKSELESSLKHFVLIDEPLFWMNIFGVSQSVLTDWTERFNAKERAIKQMLAEFKHSTTIYLSCSADIFGKPYPSLQNELKGILAVDGCNFTNDPANAEWSVIVICNSREHSQTSFGKTTSYFTYVNAQIVIDKVITSQRIYENEIYAKGGHTTGYSQAALDAYKNLKNEIGEIISKNIKQ